MNTILEIKNKIIETLNDVGRTAYFSVYSISGNLIKIRVGNHSANKMNNGDTKTLSFISNRTMQKKSGYNAMVEEWAIDLETELSDTYQTIEEILEWEDVSDNQAEAEMLYLEKI